MSSLNLNDIQRRVKSISSTKKLTNAMMLIATSNLRKYRKKLEESRIFFDSYLNLGNDVFSRYLRQADHPYLYRPHLQKRKLFIVIFSSVSMSSSFNYQIASFLKNKIHPSDEIYLIGNRKLGQVSLNKLGIDNKIAFSQSELNIGSRLEVILERILKLYENETYGSIELVYMHYKNPLVFEATATYLLPFFASKDDVLKDDSSLLIEPNLKTVVDTLIPHCLSASIYGKYLESRVSEQASKRAQMENATNNAQEIIDALTIEKAKARQGAITEEINEISSALL